MEYQAAIHWGYTVGAWRTLTDFEKAEAMGHYLVVSIRESYLAETAGKPKKANSQKGYDAMMKALGLT